MPASKRTAASAGKRRARSTGKPARTAKVATGTPSRLPPAKARPAASARKATAASGRRTARGSTPAATEAPADKPRRPRASRGPLRPAGTRRRTARGTDTPQLETRFDPARLAGHLEAARRGDAHTILGVSRELPIREALVAPPPWGQGSYEKLLALYLAVDTFGHAELGGVIYDFAEHTYFRYDDEGYALAQVHADLGRLHLSRELGLFDEARAAHYYRAALAGPYPEGVHEELDALFASMSAPLPLLHALRHALATEGDDEGDAERDDDGPAGPAR